VPRGAPPIAPGKAEDVTGGVVVGEDTILLLPFGFELDWLGILGGGGIVFW